MLYRKSKSINLLIPIFKNSEIHNYNTVSLSTDKLYKPLYRTDSYGKNSISISAINCWNKTQNMLGQSLKSLYLFIQSKWKTFLQKDASTNTNNLWKYRGKLYKNSFILNILISGHRNFANVLVTNWQDRSLFWPCYMGSGLWLKVLFSLFIYSFYFFCLFCTQTKHSLSFFII